MKIYLIDYNIDEREPKKIFVSQYSSYKIGINVNGVDNSKIKFTKKSDGKPIAAEEEFQGYNTYSFQASTPETTTYNIWVPYSNSGITFKLEVITTDSTVAELSSGGMPTDLELNSLKVTGTLSANASTVYLKGGNKLDIGTEKNDIITATNQNVDIFCTNLTANGDIECNGTFRGNSIHFNESITGISLTCDYVNGYKTLATPGFTAGDDGSGGSSITITPDNMYVMCNSNTYMQGGAGNFQIDGITGLTFNFNKDGNILKAVPRDITDSSGNTYTVLALVPMS